VKINELVKIELKKISLKKEMCILVIANIVIPLIALAPLMMASGLGDDAYFILDLFIRGTFIIWQSVLISSLIVGEIKTKTMMQLYTYPVKRSALIIAKVGLIFVIILAFSLITNLIQHSLFASLALILPNFSYSLSLSAILRMVVSSISAVMLTMMTLTVGVWMKSTIAPVVTAFLILSMMGSFNGFSLANNLAFMVMMGIVGTACVIFSINEITKNDLIV